MNSIFNNLIKKNRNYSIDKSIEVDGMPISFGAAFDKKDRKDIIKDFSGENHKDKYSLAEFSPEARNQRTTSSCVGFAVTSARYNLMKRIFFNEKEENLLLSGNYVYFYARSLRGWTDKDSGSYIRDGLKILHKKGACLDYNWPITEGVYDMPPKFNYLSKINSYERISGKNNELLDKLMHCIAVEKLPVIISVMLHDHILKEWNSKTKGIIRTPSSKEILNRNLAAYGHAMYLDSFDYKKKMFSGMNSWGSLWGDKGRFYLDFDFIKNSLLCRDKWTFGYEYY